MNDDESPLAGTEVHYLKSAQVGDEFRIFVGHCCREGEAPAAVLYLTDANGTFGSAVDIVRGMRLARHLPPLLVVGIGYRLGDIEETLAIRTRDLTPSADPNYAKLFPALSAMAGGSAALLAFIQTELMPWVQARYAVDPTDSTYAGHSLGGLFGLYALLTAPETFRRYAIGSPSLWWDGGVIFNYETAYADAHDDLPAKVFIGIGANETQQGRIREAVNQPDDLRQKATAWYIDMVDDVERLVSKLASRAYPRLSIASEIFPNEFHVTVGSLNLSRGLRFVWDAPR